jgi:hypothetical protein
MADGRLTLIDDGRITEVPARVTGERIRIRPDDVASALGWELKPEGLCRAGVCIPLRDRAELVDADGVDLAALAVVLERPLALDVGEQAAYLGTGAATRAAELATLEAPEFTLPDLSGRLHSLSEFRGKKVLLVAYASW